MADKKFTSTDFRKELTRIMPGYKWAVHKSITEDHFEATGIRTSGFNRLSTLAVTRKFDRHGYGIPSYEVKSSGFGKRSPWLYSYTDGTLARALRGLQDYYETQANIYWSHATSLQSARKAEGEAAA